MKHIILAIALVLVSCQPPLLSPSLMQCRSACVATDLAFTASHCIGEKSPPVALVHEFGCRAPTVRAPGDGEVVTVGARTTTVATARWLGWTILEGRGIPGESGSGVYGEDGALLAIVVETRDSLTYAWRLVP